MSDQASTHQFRRHEPSAWMREAIADRLRQLAAGAAGSLLVGVPGVTTMPGLVAFNLNDAHEGSREDRTCDRCRAYVPPGTTFYTGTHAQDPAALPSPWNRVFAGHQVLVAIGLCRACANLEVGSSSTLRGDAR